MSLAGRSTVPGPVNTAIPGSPAVRAWGFSALVAAPVLLAAHSAATRDTAWMVAWLLAAGAVFLVLCGVLVWGPTGRSRRFARHVVAAGIAARVALVPFGLSPTRDLVRYVWDGRLAAHGINPYGAPPSAPDRAGALKDPVFSSLEHRHISTIYPPVSQIVFGALWATRPGSVLWFRIGMTAADVGTLLALAAALRRYRLRPGWIAVPALMPLALFEVAGAGHQDSLSALLLSAMLWALAGESAKSRTAAGAAWIGSVLAKGHSAALALPVLRRTWWQGALAALLAGALVCLPFVSAGPGLFDGLRVYGSRWVGNGSLYRAIQWLVGERNYLRPVPPADVGCAIALLLAVLALSRTEAATPTGRLARYRTLMAATVVCAKIYFPWYYVGLLPVLTLSPSPAWLLFGALLPLYYLVHLHLVPPGSWIVPAAIYAPLYVGLILEWRCGPARASVRAACVQRL